jgi:YVTN family beta-propeller protein
MRLFFMDFGQAPSRTVNLVRFVQRGAAIAAAALAAGCGSAYRPVITPINPSGPPAQPPSFAFVVSAPSPTTPGVATVIDYSGDTIMALAPIGPGPKSFLLDETGSLGYTVNSDGTMTNFPASSQLQAKSIEYTTLPPTAQPIGLFAPSAGLWATDLTGNIADVFNGSPETFQLAVPLAPTPVAIAGPPTIGQHLYSISQNNQNTPSAEVLPFGVQCNVSPTTVAVQGEADAIEFSNHTVSARIPLGICPDYGIFSPDGTRVFVLNRGSDTVTVINSQLNTADSCTPFQNQNGQFVTCHPALPLSLTAVNALNAANPGSGNPPNGTSGMTSVAGPVYLEYIASTQQLVVANYDGGTISIIDVTEDEYGNDYNTYANPSCTVGGVTSYSNCGAVTGGFGTTYTVPVGNYPASVTALADGSRAYTANQADETVTVVNLSSHSVEKTLNVVGHPRTVVSTQNSLYGKVYVASPDSPYLTILRTDLDIVDTTILVEGNIVDVRVSTQNGSSGNRNNTSRLPGGGQPCNLPPGSTSLSSPLTLASCQAQPVPAT